MGNSVSVKIANSTYKDVWVKVDADRSYLTEVEEKVAAEMEGVKASGEVKTKIEWITQKYGYNRIPSGEYIKFDVPQGKKKCYVSAFDSGGKQFGSAKCFRATHGTYFNVVLCSDYAMRKGFKNRTFRCAEGLQEYWGPYCCPGCRTQSCQSPKRSGSDGWCAKIGKGNRHYFTRLDSVH